MMESMLPNDISIETVRKYSKAFRKTGKARLYVSQLYEIFGEKLGGLIPYIGKALENDELNSRLCNAYVRNFCFIFYILE